MANVRITDLSSVVPADLTDSDVTIVDDVDATPKVSYKVTIGQLRTKFASPSSNGGESSGTSALRWSTVYGQAGDFSTTLAVGGAATLSSTLAVTGNVAVNTNKFNVTAASGNTAVAGTLAVTGAATLSSTLAVTSNATVGGTLAVTGATTLSAALTYGGVTLSNAVTGTGNMVLSASPTLTGTLTAATITASGLITGSAGVTVASGQTLTLTGATVAGTPTWSSSQAITLSTAAQPNITSVGTLTDLAVSADITATTVTASSSDSGSAQYVRGQNTFNGAASVASIAVGNNAGFNGTFSIYSAAHSTKPAYVELMNQANAPLVLGANATVALTIAGSGAATFAGLITGSAGVTVASGQTLTLTGATVAGQPTWSSTQSLNTSGNAATATALATPRAINGTNFDGTAAITVTAAAGTLTGTVLNATVVTSSLTTVGALNSGSITSGFGSIDVGADAITGGALTASTSVTTPKLIGSGSTPSVAKGANLTGANSAVGITGTDVSGVIEMVGGITSTAGEQAVVTFASAYAAAPAAVLTSAANGGGTDRFYVDPSDISTTGFALSNSSALTNLGNYKVAYAVIA